MAVSQLSEMLCLPSNIVILDSTTALLCLTLPFLVLIFTYIRSRMAFIFQSRCQDAEKSPPTAPYSLPFLGHTVSFLLNPLDLACNVALVPP